MTETMVVAILSLIGTLGGSAIGVLASARLTSFRLEQLEKRVEKHNSLVERTYILENSVKTQGEEIQKIENSLKLKEVN